MNKKLYYPMRDFIKNRWEQRSVLFCMRLILSCLAWYTAIYWVADSRYNRELARLEARVTNIVTRLEGNNWRKAIEDIPILQRTLVPSEPLFFDLISVYKSLNSIHDIYDHQVVKELNKMLIAHKEELNNLDLKNSILDSVKREDKVNYIFFSNQTNKPYVTDFSYSNLSDSELISSNLNNIMYLDANLENTNFSQSSMISSYFINSNLTKAIFMASNLANSFFYKVNLDYVVFTKADLKNSYMVGVDFSKSINLSTADIKYTIYNSKEITEEDAKYADQLSEHYRIEYCQYRRFDNCFSMKYAIITNPATLFPADFDPKAHGMIDLSNFIDYIKIQDSSSLR